MNKAITTTLLVMAGTAGLAYAQAPAPQASEQPTGANAAQTATAVESELQLKQDPQLIVGKLHNGMTYMIRPTKEPAGRASVRLFVKTGSLDETEETSGISHFLEHMVFNGSRSFERGELIPAMQRLGLGFGGDANAYTSLLHTVYMLDLPNLKPETVSFAFTIMRDFADGAKLEPAAHHPARKRFGRAAKRLAIQQKQRGNGVQRLLIQRVGLCRKAGFVGGKRPGGLCDVLARSGI